MAKVIGIDLGTTNARVAVMDGARPRVITNQEGGRATPAVVAIGQGGQCWVGKAARSQALTRPASTLSHMRRLFGHRYDDLKQVNSRLPYDLVPGPSGEVQISVDGNHFSPAEISAKVVHKLMDAAADFLEEPVTEAVLTVPAHFSSSQLEATRTAGTLAGLSVRTVLPEPVAVVLAYGLPLGQTQTVAVYDFGGDAFSVSIVRISENNIEILSGRSEGSLGGQAVDQAVIEWLTQTFQEEHGMDPCSEPRASQRLSEAVENAKIE
ncbi:MAG: Hsp70 family protein, partial [Myxococcota bacterium]|nr:Hsp70 family protein [Myxococcota bacterium]